MSGWLIVWLQNVELQIVELPVPLKVPRKRQCDVRQCILCKRGT